MLQDHGHIILILYKNSVPAYKTATTSSKKETQNHKQFS